MDIFFYILQKLIKTKNVYYKDEILTHNIFNKSNYQTDFINESIHIYLLIFDIHFYYNDNKNKNINLNNLLVKAKFYSIQKFLNNIFISKQLKEKVFEIFSKTQKIYFNLIKFMYYYKLHKYRLIVSNDLMLNPINITDYFNTHIIIQNKSKYAFSINDLINIIESSLTNASMFFPKPLKPKNPYNNFYFSNCELYNIYFKIKYSHHILSTIFHLYFLDNFDNSIFLLNNEFYLREYSIKRYIYKSPYHNLHSSVLNMLTSNKYTVNLKIHQDFPKDLLVDIFKPFLFYYYIINYYTRFCEKYNNYLNTLHYKLKKFYEFNPSFGRQIITIHKNYNNKIIKKEYLYNIAHINFYNISTENINFYNELELSDEIFNYNE
jgi:hypothetical protein